MARRTASIYKPDQTIEGVSPVDIMDAAIESRHIGNNEILGTKIATVESSVVIPVNFSKAVTTGAASVKIFDANAPFKFEVIDVKIQARGASTNGTMKITNGTNDITNAMTCAVNKTMARAGTIDATYSTIVAGGTLEIVCAGDAVASTIGLVTVVVHKVD
jgi:hypothetical protein